MSYTECLEIMLLLSNLKIFKLENNKRFFQYIKTQLCGNFVDRITNYQSLLYNFPNALYNWLVKINNTSHSNSYEPHNVQDHFFDRRCTEWGIWVCSFFFSGRQNSGPMDGPRGDRIPQVHFGQRRLVHGHSVLGGDVVRRAAILELVQSRRYQEHRERIQVRVAGSVRFYGWNFYGLNKCFAWFGKFILNLIRE